MVNNIKNIIPLSWRASAKFNWKFMPRLLNVKDRSWPNFFIIGAQKCASTSLYHYLAEHPQIISAFRKEVKYFDLYSHKSLDWYKAFFPITKEGEITGEATPDYLLFPEIASQIYGLFPKAKLILIVRNPIERAYSQYWYNVRRNIETLSFEEAIKAEPERMANSDQTIITGPNFKSSYYREFSYLKRGRYMEQLHHWLKYFPKEQVKVVSTEDLQNNKAALLKELFEYLKVPDYSVGDSEIHNTSKRAEEKKEATVAELKAYFEPYNEALFNYIGKRFDWDGVQ